MSLLDRTVCSKQAEQCLYIFNDLIENLIYDLKPSFTYRSRSSLISRLPLTGEASFGSDILSDKRE